jgi:hypothetical protein
MGKFGMAHLLVWNMQVNWLLGGDTQQQEAASRLVLRARQLKL